MKYNYSDIYLTPKYSELRSRSDANTEAFFLGRSWNLPIVPANMESVINVDLARRLANNNNFYIMHRFGDTLQFVELANTENWSYISISVGVKQQDKDLLKTIFDRNLRVDCITIDIAHGHSILVKEMLRYIHDTFTGFDMPPAIIAGNVTTPDAVLDLAEWGADAIKVGIAGGAACSTKNQTGFHIPMFSCVESCSGLLDRDLGIRIPIIADGGIRENGDITKALVAGADMVMVGSVLAACVDAPGETIYQKKKLYSDFNDNIGRDVEDETKPIKKRYHGSASAKQKGQRKYVEGFEIEILCNGITYSEKYKEISESLQSSISYAGGNTLEALKEVEYITIK